MFFLALSFGLRDDPRAALEQTIGHVERDSRDAGISQPISFSASLADGRRLHCVRYASDGDSPTLYHSSHLHALRQLHGSYEALPAGAIVVVSEPLDELPEHWRTVPDSTFLTIEEGEMIHSPFALIRE